MTHTLSHNGSAAAGPAEAAATAPAATTPAAAADWRPAAMETALRAAAGDDTNPQMEILAVLQNRLPSYTARVFAEDRGAALAALRRLLPEWRDVVTPAVHHPPAEPPSRVQPIFGWWRGRGPGEADWVEVILSPGLYANAGSFVLATPRAERTNGLVESVLREVSGRRMRCRRFAGLWRDAPEMEDEVRRVSWEDVVLPPETLTDIRRNVDLFFARRETFTSLGFPWRRGILLIGPPGTGKTMICKAVAASHPEMPFLYVADFGRHNNPKVEMEAVFSHARKYAPCILAFEDIDGLVSDQTRTIFLNELDGFKNNDGLLIIASSNHPERIDEALLKRPSRFDRVYHIGLPAAAERAEYCRRFLARLPSVAPSLDAAALSARVAEMTEGFTPAFLKEAFLSAALQMAQEGSTTLGEAFGGAVLEQVEMLRRYLRKAKDPAALADLVGSPGGEIGFRAR